MGAQFNIKDAETVRLARALAEQLGGSVTGAIKQAVGEKLDATLRAQAKPSVEEALAMVKGVRALWKPEYEGRELSTSHGDLLYDERGLPK